MNTNIELLKKMLPMTNSDKHGIDSTKRALAIELLVGPATHDHKQTDRLCRFAIAVAEAQENLS